MGRITIGGHGFWDKEGVDTGGWLEKNFPAAFGGRKIFSPAPPPGGEKFFPTAGFSTTPGGDFAKKCKKMASPGGQKFFSPGCFAPGGHPLTVFFTPGVGQFFVFIRGCTPITPTPCPSMTVIHIPTRFTRSVCALLKYG